MTEEVKTEVKEEIKEEVKEVVAEPVYTQEEVKAMEDGWKPKEDFIAAGGDESTWRPAREFNDRGELFGKIDDLKKELRSTKRNMGTLKTHYEKVREVEFTRALDTLKKQKKDALEAGDAQEVVNIDERIDSTKAQMVQLKNEVPQIEEVPVHPAFQSWIDKNRWYERNTEMRDFADGVGFSYKNANPHKTPQDVLKYVEEKVTLAYPTQFTNPKRAAPSAVEAGGSPRKHVQGTFELTGDERRVMNRLVSSGVLTEAKYIADLKDLDKQGKR